MSSIPKPNAHAAAPQADSGARVSAFDVAEFDALLDAAVDGIVVSDVQGKILRVNQATEDLFGYTEDELLGKRIDMIMTKTDARAHGRYIKNYLNTGKRKIIGIGREVEAKRKDGTVFPVSLSIGEARVRDRLHFVGLDPRFRAWRGARGLRLVATWRQTMALLLAGRSRRSCPARAGAR